MAALRERCQELYGNGILSAIDWVVKFEKKGEPAVITVDVKFLPDKEFWARLGVRPVVELVPAGAIPRTEFKARRVVDDTG